MTSRCSRLPPRCPERHLRRRFQCDKDRGRDGPRLSTWAAPPTIAPLTPLAKAHLDGRGAQPLERSRRAEDEDRRPRRAQTLTITLTRLNGRRRVKPESSVIVRDRIGARMRAVRLFRRVSFAAVGRSDEDVSASSRRVGSSEHTRSPQIRDLRRSQIRRSQIRPTLTRGDQSGTGCDLVTLWSF
jgi:hypothetical protein